MSRKWRIYNVFYISLLELDPTKKEQMNDTQLEFEFEASDNKEDMVDSIGDIAIHVRELAGQLPGLYYLVLWKSYPEEKNTWELILVIQYL